ncbi:thiamine ABC transporter substrate-binding protein [Halosimplex litoreum]|uniref:Thiamine ABC transporter substrate-binding protein n=1 Tax=Halosimplex litoreum TaxID=1198301 RepID=A0A7T3KV92_9EURY|nr:thiamine ABC transporter substrate-binding protein [Halosimplex litoreum]QPV63042.1 thiamine ABC transporter substrate-binding protein [Halosimplex litoreum]
MNRRRFLTAVGAGAAGLVAGCSAEPTDDGSTETGSGSTDTPDTGGTATEADGTATAEGTVTGTASGGTPLLRVGTYPSFVDAPSSSPGPWLKERFEAEFDAELQWFAPESSMDYFLQRRQQGVSIDTDLFLGLAPENLVKADRAVGEGESMFTSVDTADLSNADAVVGDYRFDPQDRAIPVGASYISLVYNQNALDERGAAAPETFDDLASAPYENGLLVPNPQNSETGLEFMFWTIDQFGEDGYLDYWSDLMNNGTRVLQDWGTAYDAYSNDEAPMVVSFSTDQVYADRYDQDMARHQVGFLNNSGYAYLEGAAPFTGTDQMGLATEFIDFVLQPAVQAEIAQRNVALPAVDNAELPSDYYDLVYEPEEIVSFGYDELMGNVEPWLSDWSRQIATQ